MKLNLEVMQIVILLYNLFLSMFITQITHLLKKPH